MARVVHLVNGRDPLAPEVPMPPIRVPGEEPLPPKKARKLPPSTISETLRELPVIQGVFVEAAPSSVHVVGQRHGMRFITRKVQGGVLVWRVPLECAWQRPDVKARYK